MSETQNIPHSEDGWPLVPAGCPVTTWQTPPAGMVVVASGVHDARDRVALLARNAQSGVSLLTAPVGADGLVPYQVCATEGTDLLMALLPGRYGRGEVPATLFRGFTVGPGGTVASYSADTLRAAADALRQGGPAAFRETALLTSYELARQSRGLPSAVSAAPAVPMRDAAPSVDAVAPITSHDTDAPVEEHGPRAPLNDRETEVPPDAAHTDDRAQDDTSVAPATAGATTPSVAPGATTLLLTPERPKTKGPALPDGTVDDWVAQALAAPLASTADAPWTPAERLARLVAVTPTLDELTVSCLRGQLLGNEKLRDAHLLSLEEQAGDRLALATRMLRNAKPTKAMPMRKPYHILMAPTEAGWVGISGEGMLAGAPLHEESAIQQHSATAWRERLAGEPISEIGRPVVALAPTPVPAPVQSTPAPSRGDSDTPAPAQHWAQTAAPLASEPDTTPDGDMPSYLFEGPAYTEADMGAPPEEHHEMDMGDPFGDPTPQRGPAKGFARPPKDGRAPRGRR